MSESSPQLILNTCPDQQTADSIATALVEQGLAACVNIVPGIQSVYRWEGKVENSKEFLMFIKSRRELFPQIRTEISLIHSYHTPEIICLPIIDGSLNYLQWISDCVRPAIEQELPKV